MSGMKRCRSSAAPNNIFEGALVPVAQIGACLPGGMKISKSKLRGVYSFGMLCSGQELGLSDADYPGAEVDGIMILNEEYQLGSEVREILGLTDTVFEIEVGANRPDCLSMIGIARECAASLEKGIKLPDISYTEKGGSIVDYVSVEVQDKDLCERYVARAVRNVKIGPSPKWLKERLISAGVRSISNIVDITNFVMLETGQPMHAFDHKDIRDGKIIVRRAKSGETITTLDGKERDLTDDMLMICDGEGAIGIAGIMGGENSEIKDDTTTVIFESAKFIQGNVRRTSRVARPADRIRDAVLERRRYGRMQDGDGPCAASGGDCSARARSCPGEIDILSADLSPRQGKRSAASTVSTQKLGTCAETRGRDGRPALRRVFIQNGRFDGGNALFAIYRASAVISRSARILPKRWRACSDTTGYSDRYEDDG